MIESGCIVRRGSVKGSAGRRMLFLSGLLLSACVARGNDGPPSDPETAGLDLPPGFRATVFADGVGRARHLAVRENGDVYVALREPNGGHGVVGLRDTNGDGRADRLVRFGETVGTGIAVRGDHLYFSSDTAVYRVGLEAGRLSPVGAVETVVDGFPDQRGHRAKSIAFDEQGHLYVNVGAPSNACMRERRTRGSPGVPDCPQLDRQGGIWRFAADETGQTQIRNGRRFATGLRNCVALGWHSGVGGLFAVQHGRDQLRKFWKDLYTPEQSAELPSEEFHLVKEGTNAGWPYTYWDGGRGARMIAPEYGGDGLTEAPAGVYQSPLVALPAHWGPNAIAFYTAEAFPGRYRDGAFVALHGSWNRSPLPQGGFNVVFVPFEQGRPTGAWEVFADGFAGRPAIEEPSEAAHRPTGLAVGPEGALYVSDSVEGRIWKITWAGGSS